MSLVALLTLVAAMIFAANPAWPQENRPDQSQVCSVVIDVIVNNEQIQYGGDDVVISGDNNDLSDIDISPSIVQECLQNYDGENGNGNDSDSGNNTGDGSSSDNSSGNNDANANSNDADAKSNDTVSGDKDDVVDGTVPNKDLPDTGGVAASVLVGTGGLALFVGFLAWISRFRSF